MTCVQVRAYNARMSTQTTENHTADIEFFNCNHGGLYSVNDWSRDDGMFGHMLGQVQRVQRDCWIARRHGRYTEICPPTFRTQREAVAFLAH